MEETARIRKAYEKRIGDGVIGRYSLFKPGELYMLQRREERTLRLLRKHGLTNLRDLRILEIGCGRGSRLIDWIRWGATPANIYGVDLMEEFIEEARMVIPGGNLSVGSADRLVFPEASFDVVIQSTVFSSILDVGVKRAVAAEMQRVLAPGGSILWYDFRYPNPRNVDVRPVGHAEIKALFPGCTIDAYTLTLLPPLARTLAPISATACRILETVIPPLRSHIIALIGKAPA